MNYFERYFKSQRQEIEAVFGGDGKKHSIPIPGQDDVVLEDEKFLHKSSWHHIRKAMKHLFRWLFSPEKPDRDSGLSPMAHVIVRLFMAWRVK